MERFGFRFHWKSRKRNWTGFLSSFFVFLMFMFPAFSFYQKGELTREKLFILIPTLIIVALVAWLLGYMLYRSYREQFILEFAENEIIDRRFFRLTRVSYSDIEMFSPPLDDIFRPNPALREIQNELEIGEYLMITCRLKKNSKAKGPAIKHGEFYFSEAIAPTDLSDTRLELAMRSRLEKHGMVFETLYEIDDDFGTAEEPKDEKV
jgi:hypothetical protein